MEPSFVVLGDMLEKILLPFFEQQQKQGDADSRDDEAEYDTKAMTLQRPWDSFIKENRAEWKVRAEKEEAEKKAKAAATEAEAADKKQYGVMIQRHWCGLQFSSAANKRRLRASGSSEVWNACTLPPGLNPPPFLPACRAAELQHSPQAFKWRAVLRQTLISSGGRTKEDIMPTYKTTPTSGRKNRRKEEDLRRIRCGDVEVNPGPVENKNERERCAVCSKMAGGRGPRCAECGGVMHLKCSDLTRSHFYRMEGANASNAWTGPCCRVEERRKEEEDEKPVTEAADVEGVKGRERTEAGKASESEDEGRVVWAKLTGWPWWPALVLKDGDVELEKRKGKEVEKVKWLGNGEWTSKISTRLVEEFEENYELRHQKHRRGAYDKALAQAWEEVEKRKIRNTVSAELKTNGSVEVGRSDQTGGGQEAMEVKECEHVGCTECNKKMRASTIGVACTLCERRAHRTCSGLSRWRAGKNAAWTCRGCSVQGTLPLERRDMESRAVRCAECLRYCRRNVGACCAICSKRMHWSCVGEVSRKRLEEWKVKGGWKCNECTADLAKQAKNRKEAERDEGMSGQGSEATEGHQTCWKILQWNCDHLHAKSTELAKLLDEEDVDVALIQETKLRTEDPDPCIPGYALQRSDRRREIGCWKARGGGLAIIVKEEWSFKKLKIPSEQGEGRLESMAVEVQKGDGSKLNVLNCYMPPGEDGEWRKSLNRLPSGEKWIVGGDFNAHDEAWDGEVEEDARGSTLTEWADDRNLVCLNDGSATRVSKGTGIRSTPDVTFCHNTQEQQWSWSTLQKLSSDHLPILLQAGGGKTEEKARRLIRWNWKKADWEAFRDRVEAGYREQKVNCRSIAGVEEGARRVVLTAARSCIGTKVITTKNRNLMDEEVRNVLEERDRALEEGNGERWMELDGNAKELIRDKKRQEWRQHLESNATSLKMWNVLNQLKGKKGEEELGEVLMHGGKEYRSNGAKAGAFAKEYAKVSRVQVPRSHGWAKRQVTRLLSEEGPDTCEGRELSMAETRQALNEMDGNKAAGPDKLRWEANPKFLGITYDSRLSFTKHVQEICKAGKGRIQMIRKLAGSDWGWHSKLLRQTYTAMIEGKILYGSTAWMPWLSDRSWAKLEVLQRRATRVIGGLLATTPIEGVREESGTEELRGKASGRAVQRLDKLLRCKEGSIRRRLAEEKGAGRLSRRSWNRWAWKLLKEWHLEVARFEEEDPERPGVEWRGVSIIAEGRRTDVEEECKAMGMERIKEASEGADAVIFTDGSVNSKGAGGGGMVVLSGDLEQTLASKKIAGGRVASSTQAELYAIWEATRWLAAEQDNWSKAVRDPGFNCREDEVSYRRMRTGHSIELAAYRRRIGLQEEGRCRGCGMEDETMEHIWDCPATDGRRRMWCCEGMQAVCEQPEEARSYWEWWRSLPQWGASVEDEN
uniref:PWWP domain-containing protein n=2 Tax=Macrostomum lignano TaxID=282301 RepID=A0A1I8J844_9PLAT